MSDRMSRGGKNEPIYIAFKYECPPTMTEEFIDEWWVTEMCVLGVWVQGQVVLFPRP